MLGSGKDCCNPHGRCKKKSGAGQDIGRDCNQIAFEHQNSIDTHFAPAAVLISRTELPYPVVAALSRSNWTAPLDSSPPDLQILHSAFRI
jgi:hypothetical protein